MVKHNNSLHGVVGKLEQLTIILSIIKMLGCTFNSSIKTTITLVASNIQSIIKIFTFAKNAQRQITVINLTLTVYF